MKKFWNFIQNENTGAALELYGPIADETWWGDEVTPAVFRAELMNCKGPITVYINSPGGDCFAATQIWTMLKEYPDKVTVKIDGLAASAASVVAMAGDEILMAPSAYYMIHNPSTVAAGTKDDMEKAAAALEQVKEGIINAYEERTHIQRAKLARMMDDETFIHAKAAIELGFADGYITGTTGNDAPEDKMPAEEYSNKSTILQFAAKVNAVDSAADFKDCAACENGCAECTCGTKIDAEPADNAPENADDTTLITDAENAVSETVVSDDAGPRDDGATPAVSDETAEVETAVEAASDENIYKDSTNGAVDTTETHKGRRISSLQAWLDSVEPYI